MLIRSQVLLFLTGIPVEIIVVQYLSPVLDRYKAVEKVYIMLPHSMSIMAVL